MENNLKYDKVDEYTVLKYNLSDYRKLRDLLFEKEFTCSSMFVKSDFPMHLSTHIRALSQTKVEMSTLAGLPKYLRFIDAGDGSSIVDFMFRINLEDLPVYINDYKEDTIESILIKWRLEIGR